MVCYNTIIDGDKIMAKKNHSSHLNSHKNQLDKSNVVNNEQLINHLNRIINTQDKIYESKFNLDAFLHMAAEQIQQLTHANGMTIELIEDNHFVCRAATGSMTKYAGRREDKNNGLSGLCITTHQVFRSNDIHHDALIHSEEIHEMDAQSVVVAPLFHEGNSVGVIKMTSDHTNAFSDIDIQSIRVMSGVINFAITFHTMYEHTKTLEKEKTHTLDNLRKLERKFKHASQHDELTGLPNRALFNEYLHIHMAKAKRKKHLIVLMYLDIDHFKNVIETMGHVVADKLLRAFANRFKQCTRSSDIAARFGGDEFTLLIDDMKDMNEIIVIADKILQAIRQPFQIDDKSINITASIGIAYMKDKDINADNLIKQADQALYVCKNSGRNTFYIFDNELLQEHTIS